MDELSNTVFALLAIASDSDRVAYEQELTSPVPVDAFGTPIPPRDIEERLRPQLMQALRSGELVASGYRENESERFEIDPSLWNTYVIDIQRDRATDRHSWNSRSVAPPIHTLSYWYARDCDVEEPAERQGLRIASAGNRFAIIDGPCFEGARAELLKHLLMELRKDRDKGTPIAKSRYFSSYVLADQLDSDEDSVRTTVSEIRKAMRAAIPTISSDALVQTGRPRGYRLNPEIVEVPLRSD